MHVICDLNSFIMIHAMWKDDDTLDDYQLESILSSPIANAGGELHADMLMWFNRTTLETIGRAAFGYKFNALADTEPTELDSALETLLRCGATFFAFIQAAIPIFYLIPTFDDYQLQKAHVSLRKIGRQLVADGKAAAKYSDKHGAGTTKDLLSLLIHANLASDGPKLSDEEVIARASFDLFSFLVIHNPST